MSFSKGYGLADVENNVAARSDTVYRLASVAKSMTARRTDAWLGRFASQAAGYGANRLSLPASRTLEGQANNHRRLDRPLDRLQTKPARGDGYGYGWWISNSLPGLYEALGRGSQRISVLKEKDIVIVFTGGEFEPGNLAPFLIGAIKSDRPLSENPAAYQLLQNKVAAAADSPAASKIEFWSPVAAKVAGKEYRLGANSLALTSLRLQFTREGVGEIALSLPNRRIVVPIGFDDVYRMGTDSATKFPVGGRGVWLSENELEIDLNFIAKINRYNLKLRFEGNQVVLQIKEATGLANETVTGIAPE